MTRQDTQTLVLLQRWHAGQRVALEELLARDLPFVRDYVSARIGDLLRAKGEVDDYVQEAMIQALQYTPRFLMSDKAQFRALLARITENVLRDNAVHHRREKRDAGREMAVPSDSALCLDPPVREITQPGTAAHRDDEKAWIRLAIELLPPRDRDIVRMREWEHRSFADIGQHLGVAENAARMRFQRILPKLAQHVERLQQGDVDGVLKEVLGS